MTNIRTKKSVLRRLTARAGRSKRPDGPAAPLTKASFLRPAELRRLKNLLFVARTLVEGHYAGRHKSPLRGHSVEFADYREYCPGDEIADIDWKAYGRSDRLFIKLFEAQTDMVVYPLLDCSASMGFAGLAHAARGAAGRNRPADASADAPLSKLEYACYLVAALAFLVVKQGDKIALGLFREKLVDYLPPGGTFGRLYDLLNRLEHIRPEGTTNVAGVLRQSFGMMKQRGLLIVISDLLEEPAPLFAALNLYRHRRFEIIVFHLLHEEELHLPQATNVRFVDSETNEPLVTAVPEIRDDYTRRLEEHIETLRSGCAARRIDYNLITTATSYHSVLERYLVERAAAGV